MFLFVTIAAKENQIIFGMFAPLDVRMNMMYFQISEICSFFPVKYAYSLCTGGLTFGTFPIIFLKYCQPDLIRDLSFTTHDSPSPSPPASDSRTWDTYTASNTPSAFPLPSLPLPLHDPFHRQVQKYRVLQRLDVQAVCPVNDGPREVRHEPADVTGPAFAVTQHDARDGKG